MGIGQLHEKSGGVFEKEERGRKWDMEIWERNFLGKESSWGFSRGTWKMGAGR